MISQGPHACSSGGAGMPCPDRKDHHLGEAEAEERSVTLVDPGSRAKIDHLPTSRRCQTEPLGLASVFLAPAGRAGNRPQGRGGLRIV